MSVNAQGRPTLQSEHGIHRMWKARRLYPILKTWKVVGTVLGVTSMGALQIARVREWECDVPEAGKEDIGIVEASLYCGRTTRAMAMLRRKAEGPPWFHDQHGFVRYPLQSLDDWLEQRPDHWWTPTPKVPLLDDLS